MPAHFWSDLTIGQVFSFLTTVGTLILLILSGKAARNARASVRLVKRLIASVGLLPEDQQHRQGQTLTAQFANLAEQVARLERAGRQEQHDQPSVRDRDPDPVEAWRH